MTRPGRNTQAWNVLRKQCFYRDRESNARCWICKGAIDYNAKPSSTDNAWEPDHRFAVSTHPELAEVPDNVMPSHRGCNRSRKNKAGRNELGNQSRDWG